MPVWRDDWTGDAQVIVIAPTGPRNGFIRQAIVLLNEAQTEPTVMLTSESGDALTVTLPAGLLDGERRNVETNCALPITPPRNP